MQLHVAHLRIAALSKMLRNGIPNSKWVVDACCTSLCENVQG